MKTISNTKSDVIVRKRGATTPKKTRSISKEQLEKQSLQRFADNTKKAIKAHIEKKKSASHVNPNTQLKILMKALKEGTLVR